MEERLNWAIESTVDFPKALGYLDLWLLYDTNGNEDQHDKAEIEIAPH